MTETTQVITKDVGHCARCKDDHDAVAFAKLTHPVEGITAGEPTMTHWAPCPTNGEPILLAVVPNR